jgi:hypothetical protein
MGVAARAPLLGLIAIFAREREARIESVLTLRDAYRGTAHLLGEVLATTHEYTGSHSRSVVVIARQVGVSLGVSELVLREIVFGALLHDVGKMAVPNEILNKPAALTDDEMRTVRRHTLEGERLLERIGGMLGEMGPVVRHHHERFDGTGYPDGLRGEEIPLASRVISACDAFHAMISERPYREPLSLDAAINELHEGAGGQFDPRGRGRACRNRGGVGRPQPRRGGRPARYRPVIGAQARARDRLSTRATLLLPGGVAERLNAPAYAPALKAGRGHRSLVGSNPTPSASSPRARLGLARYRSRA